MLYERWGETVKGGDLSALKYYRKVNKAINQNMEPDFCEALTTAASYLGKLPRNWDVPQPKFAYIRKVFNLSRAMSNSVGQISPNDLRILQVLSRLRARDRGY